MRGYMGPVQKIFPGAEVRGSMLVGRVGVFERIQRGNLLPNRRFFAVRFRRSS